jgi:hypothetical protein
MTLNVLSLPIDIPWTRIAISPDMYAITEADPLPVKWRSSLAVFSYDPEPDPELTNPDETTTFLKVVATVTGFQPEGAEIDSDVLGPDWSSTVITNYENLTDESYPAYSAIVQLAVFPANGQWTVSQFPYLTDFEPKKREVVETVTDTGEALTQSASDLNVRKGTTSTDSTEMDNIDRGGSFGVNVNVPGTGGGGITSSSNKQVGTTATLGTQAVDVVSTDASREKRESFSHTTNLSQLYHVLDSYHAGTNRAIWFLNARPHMVDSPFTFVNGPRYLEGVQEFFAVVRRPVEMTEICVLGTLETGHLHASTTTTTTGTTTYDQQQLSQTFTLQARGGGDFHGSDDTPGAWTMQIPQGYQLDRSRGGEMFTFSWQGGHTDNVTVPAGVSIDTWSAQTASGHEGEAEPQITTYDDHVDIRAHVYGWFGSGDTDGKLNTTITIYTVSEQPTSQPTTTTTTETDFFITAREVSSCELDNMGPYVAYERIMEPQVTAALAAATEQGRDAATAANAVGRRIKNEMMASFRQSRRYPRGEVDFLKTRFALRQMLSGLEQQAPAQLTQPLYQSAGLDKDTGALIHRHAPDLTLGTALTLSPEDLAARVQVSSLAARDIFHQVIGVSAAASFKTPGMSAGRNSGNVGGQGDGSAEAGETAGKPPVTRRRRARDDG